MPAQITRNNPAAVRAPTGYSHAVKVAGDHTRIIISGQVGVALDGTVPVSGEAQIAQAFANLRAVLAEQGASVENVVKITAFLTDRELLSAYRQVRGAVFPDNHPASTLLFVSGLADPAWKFEVEAEAAI